MGQQAGIDAQQQVAGQNGDEKRAGVQTVAEVSPGVHAGREEGEPEHDDQQGSKSSAVVRGDRTEFVFVMHSG